MSSASHPVLEKAYAKLHGSYASIVSGVVRDALADLTGWCAEYVRWPTSQGGARSTCGGRPHRVVRGVRAVADLTGWCAEYVRWPTSQ
eukprot:gene56972-biopygen110708